MSNPQTLFSKCLEEPPEHLVIISTATNLYDLLPTIRSRSIVLQLGRLDDDEMRRFAAARNLPDAQTRIALAEGSPGEAVTLNLQELQARRAVILSALECAAGVVPFSAWLQQSEAFNSSRSEKLELYLKLTYGVLRDILAAWHGVPPSNNRDVQPRIVKSPNRSISPGSRGPPLEVDELVTDGPAEYSENRSA